MSSESTSHGSNILSLFSTHFFLDRTACNAKDGDLALDTEVVVTKYVNAMVSKSLGHLIDNCMLQDRTMSRNLCKYKKK